MSKESLLIIDMDEVNLRDKKPADQKQKLAVQQSIISYFRQEENPIIYTVTGGTYNEDTIPQQISPTPGDIVLAKWKLDAFQDTNLHQLLNTRDLHIVGCSTDYCVRETVHTASNLGYKVVIYKNAVLSYKSSTVAQLKQFIAWSRDPNIKLRNWK